METLALPPPFCRTVSVDGISRPEIDRLPRGTALILQIDSGLPECHLWQAWASRWRRRRPDAPFIVWTVSNPDHRLGEIAFGVARLGAAALLYGQSPHFRTIRTQLTGPRPWPEFVVRWLLESAVIDIAEPLGLLEGLLAVDGHRGSIEPFAPTAGLTTRTLRARFQALNWPRPSNVTALSRALPAAVAVQRHHDLDLLEIAFTHGYPEQTLMLRQFQRLFAMGACQLRVVAGPEPLLATWVDRCWRSPARPTVGRCRKSH